jgi:hypothetical protein
MAEPSDDFRSRVQAYKQGLEDLLVDAQIAIDRQAPDLLDKAAATARNLAQRLDDLASESRRRAEERGATPVSGGTPDRPTEPPTNLRRRRANQVPPPEHGPYGIA